MLKRIQRTRSEMRMQEQQRRWSSNSRGARKTRQETNKQEQENDQAAWWLDHVNEKINFALVLDLDRRPRVSRSDGVRPIEIHDRKQANALERTTCLLTAIQWGYHDEYLTVLQQHKIVVTASLLSCSIQQWLPEGSCFQLPPCLVW